MIEKCAHCNGTGEVTTLEAVDPGEPHLKADVGTKTCPECRGTGEVEVDEDEEESEDEGVLVG